MSEVVRLVALGPALPASWTLRESDCLVAGWKADEVSDDKTTTAHINA